MTIQLLTAALLLAALWSVLCRVNQMQHGVTVPGVFAPHLVLALGLLGGLLAHGELAKLSLAVGVAGFLLGGAWRWRYAAPPGTRLDSAAGELDEVAEP